MINKFSATNFQSLKDLQLELGKLTILTGDSDSGKSAVVRALLALALNRLTPGHSHKGTLPTIVELETDNGKVAIKREKGKSSIYVINGSDYTKTGKDVPEEVGQITGLKEYQVDTDIRIRTSIRTQFDDQFLVQERDSIISKTIGRISNINIIFVALRKASADVAALQQEAAALKAQANITQQDLDQLKTDPDKQFALDALQTQLETIEILTDLQQRQQTDHQHLKNLLQQLLTFKGFSKAAELLQNKHTNVSHNREQLKQLETDRAQLQSAAQQLLSFTGFTKATQLLEQKIQKAKQSLRDGQDALQDLTKLETVRASYNSLVKTTNIELNKLTLIQEKLDTAIRELKICPTINDTFRSGCVARIHELANIKLPLSTKCPVCHNQQFRTTSGVTCKEGHGFGEPATHDSATD